MPSTQQLHSPRIAIEPKFDNGEEWHHGLGDVPLSRIIFDPWPGTATEEDLLVFVERDKRLCELVDGTLVEKPVGINESFIASDINFAIQSFVRPRDLGSVSGEAGTVRLVSSNRVRSPDVAFFTNERLNNDPTPDARVPKISPDLAVEVLSESNTAAEMDQKRKEYFGSGTRLVWIVDPETRTVAVYTSADVIDRTIGVDGVVDGGDVLPGFTSPVGEFFRSADRQRR